MTEQQTQLLNEAFDAWWDEEGSGVIPLPEHDIEEHAKRIARIAWLNGAKKQALAQLCVNLHYVQPII
jgi:hypothetical protein